MAELKSRAWKSALLVNGSAHFPIVVQGAAAWAGVPYSADLVAFVATRPAVVDAIPILDGAVDQALERLGQEHGEAMDAILDAAVRAYQAPVPS